MVVPDGMVAVSQWFTARTGCLGFMAIRAGRIIPLEGEVVLLSDAEEIQVPHGQEHSPNISVVRNEKGEIKWHPA